MSAMSRPSGTSTLFSATRRGRSSSPPYDAELALDHVEVGERVAAGLHRGHVDDVHERGAALDVAQEVVAEAAALAGALDQAGHVGDGERRCRPARDHAEVRHQRRERVVGDLRPGPAQRGDQAGLAGAREADQADVGDHLELEPDRRARRRARRAARSRAPCAWRRPARRCRGRRGRPRRSPSRCRRRPGRRARCPASSVTTVPSGTGSTRSSPWAPLRWPPAPWPPCAARRWGLWW